MVKSDRIEWVDVAKGIAILLVILGHTLSWSDANEKFYRDIIYSFHMPLFFILSAVTSKKIKDSNELVAKIEKSFVRLIVPVIVYVSINAILEIIFMHDSLDVSSYLEKRINSLVYANGVSIRVLDGVIPGMGILWFMVTLFLAKNLYNYYDLSWRWHPLYPLSEIGAVCGSMFFICISVLIEKYKIVM